MALPLDGLEKKLGYRFKNKELLRRALTHSSYSNETGARNHHLLCNERLEFLGDSVLSIITSEYLYRDFAEHPEGDLTRMRASVVCEEALASYSEKLDLGSYLLLGRGESQNGGAKKPAVIADAFEAVLAAIYLDAGEGDALATVRAFLLPFIKEAVAALPVTAGSYHADNKSRLQEFIQRERDSGALEYRVIGESGPDHNKTFEVGVYLGSNCIGRGMGHSKRQAEQAAAKDALALFGVTER
ncbi:MAG: ribonuclease III [Clostridia bacterium]|nr:ribonuclease III [Clostridia bacterium]